MTNEIQNILDSAITLDDVQEKIITIRNRNVLLDSDVAWLYGVETMRINEAVKNNPDKFPEGYILELSKEERAEVIEIFDNPKIKDHQNEQKQKDMVLKGNVTKIKLLFLDCFVVPPRNDVLHVSSLRACEAIRRQVFHESDNLKCTLIIFKKNQQNIYNQLNDLDIGD